jgi:hypothetical protein
MGVAALLSSYFPFLYRGQYLVLNSLTLRLVSIQKSMISG